jgi:hypothetical protein
LGSFCIPQNTCWIDRLDEIAQGSGWSPLAVRPCTLCVAQMHKCALRDRQGAVAPLLCGYQLPPHVVCIRLSKSGLCISDKCSSVPVR